MNCYYLVSKTKEDLIKEIESVNSEYEIIAWPIENFEQQTQNDILDMARYIKTNVTSKLIVAYRDIMGIDSHKIDNENYLDLMNQIVDEKLCDILEVSMFKGEEVVLNLIENSHKNEVEVMLSVYAHSAMPSSEQIQIRYQAMQRLGADIGFQSFHINSELDYLSIWSAMSEFRLWKANNKYVAGIYGYDEEFVNTGTLKQGSEWLVTDNNLVIH